MAEISAAVVRALREETGLGMMDCKKALEQANGDVEVAKDMLRKKGLTTAEKKASRATSEGLVAISAAADRSAATMVEVRCETDFCARNENFKAMVADLVKMASAAPAGKVDACPEMTARLQATLAQIGENMSYARGIKISAPQVGTYAHFNGKVGVVVGLDKAVADDVLSDLCMHIAFADPMAINPSDIDPAVVAKETEVAKAQAAESGKPANIVEKMVQGKISKFLEANSLMEQPFVKDDKKKVKEVLGGAKVIAFARFAVGASK